MENGKSKGNPVDGHGSIAKLLGHTDAEVDTKVLVKDSGDQGAIRGRATLKP